MLKEYDYVILGSGLYGLYAAKLLVNKNFKIAIIEYDNKPFQRATYINQARIHNGYHYPRSYSTAIKSSNYFEKFNKDFSFAVNDKFEKVYAVSKIFSLVTGTQFERFCSAIKSPCSEISPNKYFNENTIDKAFITTEYSFDAISIRDWFLEKLKEYKKIDFFFNARIIDVYNSNGKYRLDFSNGDKYITPTVINATYASVNQIIERFRFEKYKIKYEICEVIFCDVSDNIKNTGITIVDGPFFAVMPFGLRDFHSLYSVSFAPRLTSYDPLPNFICQRNNKNCTPEMIDNCNLCSAKPKSSWVSINQLVKKYLKPTIKLKYRESNFALKPILLASEIDDSRPTVIKKFSENPDFISVLSGKINTIYDLDNILT